MLGGGRPRPRLAGGGRRVAGDHRRARRHARRSRADGSRRASTVTDLAEVPADVTSSCSTSRRVQPAACSPTGTAARAPRATAGTATAPAAFKVDLAVEGDVPWAHRGQPSRRHRARRRHDRRDRRRRVRGAPRSDAGAAVRARRPAVPVRRDPLRRRPCNPVWAYAHVPKGFTGDATEPCWIRSSASLPGFRERIVGRAVRVRADLERTQRQLRRRRHLDGGERSVADGVPPAVRRRPVSRPVCPACTCARRRHRRAPACTGCAASTPRAERCNGSADPSTRSAGERRRPLQVHENVTGRKHGARPAEIDDPYVVARHTPPWCD